jgi:fumarate reductase (CoM/CoB) subunit A
VAGRGINNDAVVLSLEDIEEEAFQRYAPDMAHIADLYQLDYRTAQFLVRPEAHFFCGGIRTDAFGATSLAGLYAVGETAGGTHGANRLANNAFPECYVFGKRAGEQAAATAPAYRSVPASVNTLTQEHCQRLEHRGGRGTAEAQRYREVRHTLRQQMWDNVGILRRGHDLQTALETIRRLAIEAHTCGGDRATTVVRCLELDNLVLTAEAVALAALSRDESRGTHYREDSPERNDTDWHCNLLVTQSADGSLQAHKAPIVTE